MSLSVLVPGLTCSCCGALIVFAPSNRLQRRLVWYHQTTYAVLHKVTTWTKICTALVQPLSLRTHLMDTSSTFRRWLRRLRTEQDMTQDMLAEQVGCAVDTIRAFESGRRRPSRAMAERLVEILGISQDQQAEFIRRARQDGAEIAEDSPREEREPAPVPPARQPLPVRIPVPPTTLIGRAAEEAELCRHLLDPACRLVTLMGAGGIGKTRLALQVAAHLARNAAGQPYIADGVSFVALAKVTAADNVAAAIADVLGCPLGATATVEESLLMFLHDRKLLLVVDNFEHVLDAAPLLGAILHQAPGVRLLVTSRERLRLPGEQVFELGGLSMPADDSRDAIDHAEAVLLFLERARHASTTFALTPINRLAVATICRLVDGMPLGIELAAAWTRALSPDEIADEIARSLDFLTLSDRTADLRHRSMRAVIDHSWALLTAEERHVLAQLSIFRGGCTREAAQTVTGATLPILAGLLDKSLVRRTPMGRYEMHELVRQYAAERLAADPAMAAKVHAQHCAYYTGWLAVRASIITSIQQHTAVAEISTELDNLRAAWQYGIEQRDAQAIARISDDGLLWFYEVRSWYQEAELACRRAAAAFHPPTTPEEEKLLGTLTGMQGWFTFRRGQPDTGMKLLEESVRWLRRGDSPQWLFNTLVQLGYLALFRGEFERAAALVEEHAALARRIENPWVQAHVILQQAALHSHRAPEVAYTCFHESLLHIRAVGDNYLLAMGLNHLGEVALDLGHTLEAEQLFMEAHSCSVAMNNGIMEVVALSGLASVACVREAWADGVTYARQAVARSNDVGEVWSRAKALVALGEAELGSGDAASAGNGYTEALGLSLAMGLLPTAVQALVGLASIDLHNAAHHPKLPQLLALVRHHAVTNRRTQVRVDQLLNVLAAKDGAINLADDQAQEVTPDRLASLLAAYAVGRATSIRTV